MNPSDLVVLPSSDGHFIFDKASLDDIISKTLPSVPEKNTLMWGVGTDLKGADAAVVFTREAGGIEWQAKAAVAWSPATGLDGGASLGGTKRF